MNKLSKGLSTLNSNCCQFGGIDVGATNIETVLFDESFTVVDCKFNTTSKDYELLTENLLEDIRWLRERSNNVDLPIGIGFPGFAAKDAKEFFSSNLSLSPGHLPSTLSEIVGPSIYWENDSNCFSLGEALLEFHGRYTSLIGLIIGTGIGSGYIHKDDIVHGLNRACGEIGHLKMPYDLVHRESLPILQCGCGQYGCYESLASGEGLRDLVKQRTGKKPSTIEIVDSAKSGISPYMDIMQLWARICSSLVEQVCRTFDPECIVLGGSLGKSDYASALLITEVKNRKIKGMKSLDIFRSESFSNSGAKGAALLAKRMYQEEMHFLVSDQNQLEAVRQNN